MNRRRRGRPLIHASVLVAMLILSTGCQALDAPGAVAADTAPPAATPNSAERGRRLFNKHCALCHGQEGERGAAPLRDAAPTLDDSAITNVIANGWPEKGMPAPATLTADQVSDLLAFIRSWQK